MKITTPPGFRGRFATEHAVRAAYSEAAGPYRIVPGAVAIPADTGDLIRLVEWAREVGTSLIPRGAGSGMPGGNLGRGVIVDLQQFNRPLRVSAQRIVNTGAAVLYRDIERAASHFELTLPPDPSSGAFCTIGGMIATNAAGPRSLRYGSVRRWVRGVELVTADGQVGWVGRRHTERRSRRPQPAQRAALTQLDAVERFSKTVAPTLEAAGERIRASAPPAPKSSCGYALTEFLDSGDLVDLLVGSEGTLGFITRAELTLETRPAAVATALLGLRQLDDLTDAVTYLHTCQPAVIELMDRSLLDFTGWDDIPPAEAVLIVEFERPTTQSAQGAVGDAVRGCDAFCTYAQAGITADDRERIWAVRRRASAALAALPETTRSLQVVEDGCVPVSALSEYVRRVREAADRVGIPVVAFGHAGDGHLHVNALPDVTQPDFRDRLAALVEDVTDAVVALHGVPSGEHGDGRLRTPLLHRIFGGDIIGLFGEVKRAFDPDGIMNPGVIVAGASAGPLDDLKVGPDAEAIPEYIAEALHRLERTRGWATSKVSLVK